MKKRLKNGDEITYRQYIWAYVDFILRVFGMILIAIIETPIALLGMILGLITNNSSLAGMNYWLTKCIRRNFYLAKLSDEFEKNQKQEKEGE